MRVAVGRICTGERPRLSCVLMLLSTSPATTPRPIESCAPIELPARACHARQAAESHRGLLHARNDSGTRHGPLGSFLWGHAWRGGCRQPSRREGIVVQGSAPLIMHSNPSSLVATPPVAFRPPRTATRAQIRGAGYSYRSIRDGRSGAEPLRNGALIGSQHFSQHYSQQCSQTRSRDGFFGSTITQWKGMRAPATHSNTHRPRSCEWKGSVAATRRGVVPVVVDGPAHGHDRVWRAMGESP